MYAPVRPEERPESNRPSACCSGVPRAFAASTASGLAFGELESAPPSSEATAAAAATAIAIPSLFLIGLGAGSQAPADRFEPITARPRTRPVNAAREAQWPR